MVIREWAAERRFVALCGLLLALGTSALADNNASEERMRKDITYLASAECEGRGVNTEGIHKAANYIASEFKKAGLKPGGVNGSYFQPFTIPEGPAKLDGKGVFKLRGPLGQEIELTPGRDFEVLGLSGSGAVKGPVVFVGYGASAAEIGYDDFKGVDVAGKVAIVLRRVPRWTNENLPFDGDRKTLHATEQRKMILAELNQAAAVLLVNDASLSLKGDPLINFTTFSLGDFSSRVPALHIRRDMVDAMLTSSLGMGLRDIEKDIDRELKPRSAALSGWTATIETKIARSKLAAKNVIAVLEGAGPLAKETVVIGAHYDHLGYGPRGSRLKDKTKRVIHHGADDNASGTTAVLELARRFAQIKDRQGRRLAFMAFSGEEWGLLGSRHYCEKKPLFPLRDTVAMINLDMIGRLPTDKATQKEQLIVEGVKTAKGFEELLDKFNKKYDFKLVKQSGGSGYSDHASFYRQKVPVMFLWNGTHVDYHLPTDTADKVNIPGMRRITELAEDFVGHFASVPERPEYLAISGKKDKGIVERPRFKGPTLGIFPSYFDEEPGVVAVQVLPDRPADKAGLKAGDRIIAMAGKEVRNIEFYTALLETQLRGQTIEVVVMRDDKRLTFKVTLE
jgi:hypothetical protein